VVQVRVVVVAVVVAWLLWLLPGLDHFLQARQAEERVARDAVARPLLLLSSLQVQQHSPLPG
jgi:hypothetical protein